MLSKTGALLRGITCSMWGALFQECVVVQGWDHQRHELEAQFWKHVEYFPHDFNLQCSDVVMLRMKLNWLYFEALTIEESTAVLTFRTLDKLQKIMTVLATICEVMNDGNPVNKLHVALFGKTQYTLCGLPNFISA
ncbi:hypothetical protein BDN67DRAFT_1015361 [Paxillus ammoniavirescens]|nr:hypothetical protein BDN67DRAFT_1015361 [Paxillus ammoniavirescens]